MADTRNVADLIAGHEPGFALEQRFYIDPGIYALEIDKVIRRNWFLAGHTSELAESGDFKLITIAGESAIIVRDTEGGLRAFANVCRHRGSVICLEQAGHTRRFECPYHGWTYGLDGRLLAARSMREDVDFGRYGLHELSLDVVHGLVFICFSDTPPGLQSAKDELAGPMAMFDFENLKVAAHKVYDIPANWKLAVENYQECYHCATAHPEYSQRHTLKVDYRRRGHLQKAMLGRMEACGLKVIEIDRIDTDAPPGEMGFGYSRTAMFDGFLTGSRDGNGLAPLLGNIRDYDGGASDFTFGAFSFLLAYSDHVVAYVFKPVDLTSCSCDIYWMLRSDAVEGRDYDVDELTWLWDVTTLADKKIIADNWRGVQSAYYAPGPFSEMEKSERRWTEWLLLELQRP